MAKTPYELAAQLDTRSRARSYNYGRQADGSYTLNTNVTDKQAEETAGRVSREQFERYMTDFVPQEERLSSSIGETRAQGAAKSATGDAIRSRAALERMRQRYGTSLTKGQSVSEDRQGQRTTTLGALSATNTGRQMDEDRNFNLQGTMLNIGNNLSSRAMSGLTQSSNNASARQQSYDQAKAKHSAQKSQQRASIATSIGTALAFM
jgi:hypothetical protein